MGGISVFTGEGELNNYFYIHHLFLLMSKMLPPYLPTDVRSTAEQRIFEKFRVDPETQDWVVLHSLGLSRHTRNRYGEIDFVVLAPNLGIFCLEVKGGRIVCSNGVWYYTNRDNITISSPKNPFVQAREGMFSLQNILRNNPIIPDRLLNLVYGYGVLFPDIEWEHTDPEHESWQVYDRAYRNPISKFIKDLARFSPDALRNGQRPTHQDIKALQQALRPDFEYIVKPSQQMSEAETALLVMTEEQYHVLDALEGNSRLVIEGGAGTGKTLLAIEAARRSAMAGKSTLLLCFNRLLGFWIEDRVANFPNSDKITVGNAHRVFETQFIARGNQLEEFESNKNKAMNDKDEQARFFREDFSLYALDAVTGGFVEPFDVLIIDEGQDLVFTEYLDVFDALLKGGLAGGRWIIFADFARQAIYAEMTAEEMREALAQRGQSATFLLKYNCRNTKPIGMDTALLSGFEALPFLPSKVKGNIVEYRFWKNEAKQREILTEIINNLLQDGLHPNEITILSPSRREKSCLREPLPNLKVEVVDLTEETIRNPPSNAALFATIHAYKGLENRAIIIVDIKYLNDDKDRQILYVSMSRPLTRLFMLISQQAYNEYKTLVSKRQQLDA